MEIRLFRGLLFLIFSFVFAQQDTIRLEEISIEPTLWDYSSKYAKSIKSIDSTNLDFTQSLQQRLSDVGVFYFKENGLGMVSSIGLRGTTAQQTSVLWNGLNINSLFLGQADFNAISTANSEQVNVVYGGSSSFYGGAAIGGVIDLVNKLNFSEGFQGNVDLGYASFNHLNLRNKTEWSNENLAIKLALYVEKSDNDFEIEKVNYQNMNGQWKRKQINFDMAYRFDNQNKLSFFNEIYTGDRNFSLLEKYETPTRYEDFNQKHMLRYRYGGERFSFIQSLALLKEEYKYYPDIKLNDFSGNNVISLVSNSKGIIRNNHWWTSIFHFQHRHSKSGLSKTGISRIARKDWFLSLIQDFDITKKISAKLGFRKDWVGQFVSPFTFDLGFLYRVNKELDVRAVVNQNFRAPSFNDLYWKPGGNENLKPEISLQQEIGVKLNNDIWNVDVSIYHNNIENMIRWIPDSSGVFFAQNVDGVEIFGLDLYLSKKFFIGNMEIKPKINYAYNQSENKINSKQLIYSPKHMIHSSIDVIYAGNLFRLNHFFTGEVYFAYGNNYKKPSYNVFNLLFSRKIWNSIEIGVEVNNLLNKIYTPINGRYMPTRNYAININYKF